MALLQDPTRSVRARATKSRQDFHRGPHFHYKLVNKSDGNPALHRQDAQQPSSTILQIPMTI